MNEKVIIKRRAELELKIESLAYGGMGVAKKDDFVIFVKGAIPGQIVNARVYKKKKGYAEAQTLNIVSESPNAVEPKCNHFYICSKIQNLSYKEQLKEKGNFQLIDIGCGKGKVLCIWELMFKKSKVRIVGVEYSEELIRISKKNLETLNSKNTSLFKVDALDLDLGLMEDNLLVYIYIPFNENILYKFLKKIEPKTVAIVYINPIHTKCFKKHNFNLNYEKKGWHPNASYNIYTNF